MIFRYLRVLQDVDFPGKSDDNTDYDFNFYITGEALILKDIVYIVNNMDLVHNAYFSI
jgi:hypothetical protein